MAGALYGSAYFTGVSNIFRFELEAGKLEAVTNTDTGFFRPIPLGGEELIAFRYTGTGFVPARLTARPIEDVNPITFMAERLVAEHPVIETWNVGSPAKIPYDTMAEDDGRVPPRRRAPPRVALSDRAGLQGHGGDGRAAEPLRSA